MLFCIIYLCNTIGSGYTILWVNAALTQSQKNKSKDSVLTRYFRDNSTSAELGVTLDEWSAFATFMYLYWYECIFSFYH